MRDRQYPSSRQPLARSRPLVHFVHALPPPRSRLCLLNAFCVSSASARFARLWLASLAPGSSRCSSPPQKNKSHALTTKYWFLAEKSPISLSESLARRLPLLHLKDFDMKNFSWLRNCFAFQSKNPSIVYRMSLL